MIFDKFKITVLSLFVVASSSLFAQGPPPPPPCPTPPCAVPLSDHLYILAVLGTLYFAYSQKKEKQI